MRIKACEEVEDGLVVSQVHVDTGLSESSQTKEHKGNTKDEVACDFALLAIDKDDGEEEKELPAYHEVVDYMKQQNAKKYFGMLDEDFVPHVDAFWHGLEMLCVFIDNHIRVDYCAASSRVAQEERDRILRNISGSDFNVSNERLEELLELKKRLEEKRKQQIATGRYKNECT